MIICDICKSSEQDADIQHWTIVLNGKLSTNTKICVSCADELNLKPAVVKNIGEIKRVLERVELLPYMDDAEWDYDDMYKAWHDKEFDFEDIFEYQRAAMIKAVGFRIWKEPDGLALQDMDEGNLGDIENERFSNTEEICERIGHYFDDFFEEY